MLNLYQLNKLKMPIDLENNFSNEIKIKVWKKISGSNPNEVVCQGGSCSKKVCMPSTMRQYIIMCKENSLPTGILVYLREKTPDNFCLKDIQDKSGEQLRYYFRILCPKCHANFEIESEKSKSALTQPIYMFCDYDNTSTCVGIEKGNICGKKITNCKLCSSHKDQKIWGLNLSWNF